MSAPPGHEALMERLYPSGNPFLTGRAPIMGRYSFFKAVAADKLRQAQEAVQRHLDRQLTERLAEISGRVG